MNLARCLPVNCCTNKKMQSAQCKLSIIFGTQTGQSKSIAEEMARKASENGYDVEMVSMDDSVEKMPWSASKFVIFITSSTGDGDPPENALKFWRKLRSKDLAEDFLSGMEYALLGLGDTNYTTYLGFPKGVEKQLQKLGARQFYKSGFADDAVGLETVVDPWIENLWPAISQRLSDPHQVLPQPELEQSKSIPETPVKAEIVADATPVIIQPEPAKEVEAEVEKIVDDLASLTVSTAPLNECNLKVPLLPQSFLELSFDSSPAVLIDPEYDIYKQTMPSSKSSVYPANVKYIKQLTGAKALKTTLEISLDLSEAEFEYEPGDAIGIYCSNSKDEVELLLNRLNLLDKADLPFILTIKKELVVLMAGSKPKYEIPAHLPKAATLRYVLTNCTEIRSVPRKALLRVLAEFTSAETEKRRLLELSSAQGSDDYTRLIRQTNVNILDLLNAFPSCHPPIERLLEQWPRLLARPYSFSSSPLIDPKSATFLFNVVDFPAEDGRTYERQGVATGGFNKLFQDISGAKILPQMMHIYLRTNNGFRMPDEAETPMILIGPGTGLAPFLGFLAHREELLKRNPSVSFGPIWLLYGCRNKDQDYLYRNELENWHSAGIITRLLVCFSRDGNSSEPKYVQDLIKLHQTALVRVIGKGARIYVCGDAANMAKDVMGALTDAVQSVQNIDEQKAKDYILQLQKEKRYLQDIWT